MANNMVREVSLLKVDILVNAYNRGFMNSGEVIGIWLGWSDCAKMCDDNYGDFYERLDKVFYNAIGI